MRSELLLTSSSTSPGRYRRRIWTLGLLFAAVLLAVGGPIYLRSIERDLERRVPDELAEVGVRGVTASFSGQTGVLRCPAPLSDPERVLDLAHEITGVATVSLDRSCRVTSAPSVTTLPPGTTPPPSTGPDGETLGSHVEPADGFATVGELVSSAPRFSVVASLIAEAQLSDLFDGDEPITFFAPDNDAFDALTPDVLAELRNEPTVLAEVIRHHVVAGRRSIDDLGTAELLTVDGRPLPTTGVGTAVSVDGAAVSDGDLGAGNGVVHRIDGVLLPDGLELRSIAGVPEFVAVLRPGTLELSGPVVSSSDRARLVLAASSVLHRSNVVDDMTVDASGIGADVVEALADLVAVLPATLITGSVGTDGTDVVVRGTVLDDDARAVLGEIADRRGVLLELTDRTTATSEQAEVLQADLSAVLRERPLDFAPNSADLADSAVPVLDVLAALVKRHDGLVVTVEGHTDSAGDPAANLELSEFRAAVVYLGLVQRGVPQSQLSFVGRGGESPVVVGGVEDPDASRRVELVVEHVG